MPEDLWPSFKQSERQLSRLERRPSFKEKLKDRNYSLAMQRYREQEAAQEAEIARLRRRIPGENVDPEQKDVESSGALRGSRTPPSRKYIDSGRERQRLREKYG